jgi:hypothetical protein
MSFKQISAAKNFFKYRYRHSNSYFEYVSSDTAPALYLQYEFTYVHEDLQNYVI